MSENGDMKKIYAKTLDPVHIGAGGYRLGRVDNTIVRDPATNIPKIPGTSIAGVVREFYRIHLMENDCEKKGTEEKKRECAEKKVKEIFGDESKKGIVRFYDGEILFFPVSSIQGIVWITTKEIFKYWFESKDNDSKTIKLPKTLKDGKVYALGESINNDIPLNLGWLLLEVEEVKEVKEGEKAEENEEAISFLLPQKIHEYLKRIAIVSDRLFSHLVNDNLEVRTSVRIDPETGTAKEGALFTYEAIPRGTIIGFEVGIDKTRNNNGAIKDIKQDIIDKVSPYFKSIGIGGMGTRGFGRLEIVKDENSDNGKEGNNDGKS